MTQFLSDNIQDEIIQILSQSEESIYIAVGWFTNQKFFDELLIALKRNVDVKIIFRNDYINNSKNSLEWNLLLKNGASIFLDPTPNKLHHKLLIVDEKLAVSGSYNWTLSAEFKNFENIIIFNDGDAIRGAINTFQLVLQHSESANLEDLNVIKLSENNDWQKPFLSKEKELESVISEDEPNVNEIDILYCNKEYKLAIILAMKLLKREELQGEIYHSLGWIYYRQNSLDDALHCCEKSISLDYDEEDLYNLMGSILSSLNRIPEALHYFDKALSSSPSRLEFLQNKMDVLESYGKSKEAQKIALKISLAAKEILVNKDNEAPVDIMKAYIAKGMMSNDVPKLKSYGEKALYYYNLIQEQDQHNLDDINLLINYNLKV